MNQKTPADITAKYLAEIYQGAKTSTIQHAHELRRQSTKAEQMLWSLLRNRKLKGKKFRRQHAIAHYVADFYCHECKLVVELDGYFHLKPEIRKYDNARTALLNELGIHVIRFWNEEVINDTANVLKRIANYL